MRPLRVLAAAEKDLGAAVDWYERQGVGLGSRLLSEVSAALELIQRSPTVGSPVPRVGRQHQTRRVPLRRFPYFVIYRERDAEIQVIAFAHTSRKPGYWRGRSGPST